MQRNSFPAERGLSPVILVIVLAVLAILAGVAIPKFLSRPQEAQDSAGSGEETLREQDPAVPSLALCQARCRDQYGGSGSSGFDACMRACGAGAEIVDEQDERAAPPPPPPPLPQGDPDFDQGAIPPPPPPPPAVQTVVIENFTFSPSSLTIPQGTTIVFVNRDSVGHTATADGGSFDTGILQNGQSKTLGFTTKGVFSYHCTPHPYMTATITVQ